MTAKERAQLLAQRHKALFPGLAKREPVKPRRERVAYCPMKRATWGGFQERATPFVPEPWTTKPDAKADPLAVRVKHRRKGAHALERIAEAEAKPPEWRCVRLLPVGRSRA